MVRDGESSSIGLVRSAVNYRTILKTPPSPPPCSAAAANPPTKLLAAKGEFEDEFFLVRWWCSPWRKRKGMFILICGILLVVFSASFSWNSSEDGGQVRVRPLWRKNTNRSKKGDVDGGMWTIQDGITEPSTHPVWVWDHYLYNTQNSTTNNGAANPRLASSSDTRNLLIAQVVSAPLRSTKHPPYKRHDSDDANRAAALLLTQEELAEISSRPNRAYARQWGRNYLRYTAPLAAAAADDKNDDRNSNMQCSGAGVDHVVVLNAILSRQPPRESVPSDKQEEEDNDAPSSSSSPSWLPRYDALVLLPPDAIITDLDFDLLTMIPDDKLLVTTTTTKSALVDSSNRAGKEEQQQQQLRQQNGGIVFWNLRHPLARTVVQRLWSEIVLAARVKDDEQQQQNQQQGQNGEHPSEFVCNGETNYIQWLLEEILPSLLLKDKEQQEDMGQKNLQSLVGRLEETADGFVFAAAEQASSSSQVQFDAITGNGAASGGGYCLKCFPQQSPGGSTDGPTIHRSHHQQQHLDEAARVTLQTTADAVCYRYYPKCEVF